MKDNVFVSVKRLVNYGEKYGLIEPSDRIWATNRLLEVLNISNYEDPSCSDMPKELPLPEDELDALLSLLCDYAFENRLIDQNSVEARDLFDAKLMGAIMQSPSRICEHFLSLYAESPGKATNYFYTLNRRSNYIREGRVKKDLRWKIPSEYGEIDISINLSKPEKDPKAIAAAKLLPRTGYPKCLLCRENEGFAGSLNYPARQNLRLIPMRLDGRDWFFQYSPYVYYNEHCIVLSSQHVPMKITRSSFAVLLDFVEYLPHYFIGSNADLPIVGGSILTHDHMQGGRYSFAMEKAPIEYELNFHGFEDIKAGIVKWPMSVIRLRGSEKERLTELADKVLRAWRIYSDKSAFIYAESNGEPHNTITPIARKKGSNFELDLVLRNNITTIERPLGVFHPGTELHNIKKENVGLIEVMGLAVLPSRLKTEMELLAKNILSGGDISSEQVIAKHKYWFDSFAKNYEFSPENIWDILRTEIGNTFIRVLEDAGVYKRTEDGMRAFIRFCESINRK